MKMVFIIAFCMLFLNCISFNPSHGIMTFGQNNRDSYQTLEGTVTTESFVIIPIGPSLSNIDDMGLKIGRISLNGNIIKYTFQAEVHSTKAIFANSIRVKIDDNIYLLEDNNPIRQVLHNGYFLEVLAFKITPEMLEELKSAVSFCPPS